MISKIEDTGMRCYTPPCKNPSRDNVNSSYEKKENNISLSIMLVRSVTRHSTNRSYREWLTKSYSLKCEKNWGLFFVRCNLLRILSMSHLLLLGVPICFPLSFFFLLKVNPREKEGVVFLSPII